MRTATLVKRSLIFYWRTNLAVVAGVAAAVAVLAGALLVGDSVRGSLRDLFLDRLGKTSDVITAPNFFRERLADDLQSRNRFNDAFQSACPLIMLEAVVTHDKSGRRASQVQVYGVDDRFWKFHGRDGAVAPNDREILISDGLARELGCAADDSLLIRVEKPAAIPTESLHGRKEDVGRTIRLNVREVLKASGMGDFSIRPRQGTIRAAFVSLKRLQKDLEQPGKANTILISESSSSSEQPAPVLLEAALKETFTLEDLGIKLRALDKQQCLSFESSSGLINDDLADKARAAARELEMRDSSVFTYLANSIRIGDREVPYSLVTALDETSLKKLKPEISAIQESSIILNEWAARDLGAHPGDSVELDYYVWLPEGRLATRKSEFKFAGETPIAGAAADRDLAPDYPGITETESFSDWDPPFPIDLNRVRPRDEDYWRSYRTTPKAFISLPRGQEIWQSRFGKLTSIRLFPPGNNDLSSSLGKYARRLREHMNPVESGLAVYSVKVQGLDASRGATDFGEYFAYFSFFLVISALLLTALFFRLGVEQRVREIGLLEALGFGAAKIRALFLMEGVVLSMFGGIAGVVGALLYGWLMMFGLRTWWVDAVGTTLLTLHVSIPSLAAGFAGGLVMAGVCIVVTLRGFKATSPRGLLAGSVADSGLWKKRTDSDGQDRPTPRRRTRATITAFIFTALGLLLLGGAAAKAIGAAPGFFGAGSALLIALFCFESIWLRRDRGKIIEPRGWLPVSKLGFRNATNRPGRSILCIALIAAATFIIVAVDAFRRERPNVMSDKRSGSGGFPLLAESLLPISNDPNSEE